MKKFIPTAFVVAASLFVFIGSAVFAQNQRVVTNFGNRESGSEEIFVGDFTGDGRADIAIHDRQTGDWFVGRSTGSAFVVEQWATK